MDFPKKSKKAQSSSILGQDSNQSSKLKATIASLVEEIHSKMVANLWQMYYEFSSFMPINYKEVIDDPYEIWTTYLPHEIEKYEKDHFSGEITLWKPGNIIDHSMMSAFWKSCDIFEGVSQVPWRFRVSEKAFDKIKDSCRELKVALLKKMIEFSLGFILEGYNCEIIRTGPCIGMVFFSFPFIEEDYDSFNSNIQWHGIAACIVERIPVIKDHKVIEYSYEQYIKLLSVVDNTNLVPNEVDNFCDDIREDPDRWLEYSDWIGCLGINNQWRNAMGRFYPIIIPQLFLTEEESNSIAFDAGIRRWIWTDPDILENWEKKEKFKNNLVKLLSEENSCKDFIRLLKTLPNMTLKLTDEELELISTPGNVLTIGRSGTGKTTCSLLRMFSAEILFRYKMQKNKKLKAEDIDNPLPLHFVFATASPVLTNEVKIYYKKLKKLIKNGLKSKEKQQNLEEEKEIELKKENPQLTQVEEIEKEINTGPHSMKLLKNEDFPLFATIRKLVLMIDGSLERPFFSRDKNGRVIGSSCNFEWHNEQKGALEISKDYKKKKREQSEFISDSDSDEEYNKYYETDWDESQRQIRSWEIDFAAFSERFYPSLTWKNKFSPLILWTEISAYIKGSPKAYLSRGFYLSQEEYLELGRKSSMLSKEEKVEVYRAFGLYEDWKRSVNGYDFQDLVNYILCEIHYHGYKGIPIHYMMIDEVQDLTSATLNLLMQVTDQKLVFSGDTAQTIAKGVGFRFCDLKSLFFEASMTPPTVRQLTINFRSHNQILELANSVVALLETLFPLTIDKMGKEKSLKDGPHPIIINSGNPEDLLEVLYCSSEENPQLSNIQFGCSQVVIVRNQSSKFKLPSSLNTALCLTVYEAKGLEFDDVILYNVFTDSEMPVRCWKALYHFIIKNKDYGKIQDDPNYKPSSLEDLENETPKLTRSKLINKNKYSTLCTELKQLYVAITRPKIRLIIYDDNPEYREKIQSYWERIGTFKNSETLQNPLFQTFTKASTKEEWTEQGQKMMSHQFYEQAAKCFRAADNILLESKALAYFKASQASELISAEKKRWWPAKNRNFKKECKEIEEKAKNEFISAGNEFLRISEIDEKEFMLKEAARCFASAKENERAADIYQSIGLISQAAEAYLASGHYEAAGDLFTEKFEYIRAIDAYRCGRKWDKLVHCIYKCRNNMADKERQKFIKKYVPLALENLMPQAFLTLDEDKNTIVEEKEEENEEEKEEPASEESFSLIQESHNSFTLIGNSADSFSMIKDDDEIFEVLQDIDPKDEWLISDSGSVIDSLSPTLNKDSILSDYSIIDNPHTASLNQGGKLINTKTDIFIEDQAMLKIIEYVGMFSSDVSSFLNSFKSAESLISTQKIAESWELIDLDEISPELLGIILDALEEFGMYKLCLFVCNRYQLEERLGRYVVSVAFKYSNNPLLKPSDLNKPNFIKAQSQRANLAFSAVHNVLEMINPEYLALKKDFDGKNLGIESFRGLLLLGYWKKTVYIMDRENSLAVTSSFMDFKNFKNIYLIFENSDFLEKINEESFAWLPFNTPSNYEEVRAAKIALDSVICSLNTLYFVTQKSTCSSIKKFPNFPEYFFYNENFWKFIHKQDDSVLMNCFRQSVGEIKDFLRGKGFKEIIDECRAWDALSFFTQLLLGSNYQPAIKSFLQKLPYEDFEEILLISSMAIKLLCFNAQVLDSRYSTLVFAMLAPLGIRQLISSPAMAAFPYFSHVLMHKNNILLQSINLSDIERVYTVDTEGQFLILPIENILKAFSKEIVTSLTSIIKERNIYPKSKKYPETASALINRYGELWMINFINSHIDGNPYKLENLSSAFLKESIEYKEYSINKKRLQRIIDLADGDRKSINFIKKQNKKEIAFLEKEIQKYKDNSVENKENLLNLIIEKCSFMPKAEVKLTKLASHALFSQAQIFMELSGKSNEPTEIVEELFMSYELCKLSGYSIYFHEMLNQRLKPTISASGEKMFKNHSFYHHAVAYLDIDSYFDQGSFESASTSILSLLNAQFFEIDIEQVIKLTEKAVICWAISLGTPIKLSKFHNKYLPKSQYTRNGDIIIKGVAQGKRPSISAELFEWTVKILSQINKSDTSIKSKSRLASKIYGFLLLIIQYGNPSILYESMTKVQLNREFELIGITNEIQEIAEIANLAALEEYQAISQSSPLKNGEIMVIHEELISEEESLQRLNNSWISETRLFAAHHEKVYILRKLKKYRKRVQRSNIQQQILFSSLSSKVQETLSFKKDWKSKNFLKIISIIEEFQAEINDCIYKASLKKPLDFHYLLKQMNWLLTVFSSIINCITSQDIDCSETIKNSIQEIEAAIKRMNLWKNVIILQNKEIEIKHQKKWNFKWRQEIMNKRKKGIKRQEALMKKRDKLKSS